MDSSVLGENATEVARLRALLSDSTASLPLDWRITPTEESIFRALLANDVASPAIISEVAKVKTAQVARVHIFRLRKKLTSRGVEIETIRDRGWRLIGREHWARQLAPSPKEGVN